MTRVGSQRHSKKKYIYIYTHTHTEHMNVVIQPGRPHVANGSWVLDHLLTPCCTEVMNF